jgi:hypothetical protein
MDGVDHVLTPEINVELVEQDPKVPPAYTIKHPNAEIYLEALHRYPNDECIDREKEKSIRRKIDRRILPLLAICYFFYVSTMPSTDCKLMANRHGN